MRFSELISSDQVTPLLWLLNCVFVLWSCRSLISLPSACLIWTGMSLCSTLTVPWTEYLLWNKLESNPLSVVQVHKHIHRQMHQMLIWQHLSLIHLKELAHKCCLFGNRSIFLTLYVFESLKRIGSHESFVQESDYIFTYRYRYLYCSANCSVFL